MKKIFYLLFISSTVFAQINFDDYFLSKTLRLDYYHFGNADTEQIAFEQLIEEPVWGGSKVNLIDTLGLGNYFFKVFDTRDNKLIYSRGYSTLFQEWQTTAEAKKVYRSFSGAVIFPYPKDSVKVEIFRRDRQNNFKSIFTYIVDPENYFITPERRAVYNNFKVHYSGDPNKKLDIVFIPEGYTKEEADKFEEDCNIFAGYLFEYDPFSKHKKDINIWGIKSYSEDSGTDIPGDNIWEKTAVNSHFYTFDSERYLMTTDYKRIKDIASNAPYDQIYIIVNTDKYGGGSIYNLYNVTAAHNKASKQVFIHEFGHGLAGLADEYGADDTYEEFYPLDVEPWEVNVTTLVDFEKKWKNLIKPDTPIPTPPEEKYEDEIGVFEGAGYVNKGVYRPTLNSIMNSFASNEFNLVCKNEIEKIINFYSK